MEGDVEARARMEASRGWRSGGNVQEEWRRCGGGVEKECRERLDRGEEAKGGTVEIRVEESGGGE